MYKYIDDEISLEKQNEIKWVVDKFLHEANEKFDVWCTKNGYQNVNGEIIKKEKDNSFIWDSKLHYGKFKGKNLRISKDENINYVNNVSDLGMFKIDNGSLIEIFENPFKDTNWI